MLRKVIFIATLLCSIFHINAQEVEVNPPYHIKTISFVQNGQNAIPVFQLGDTFQLQFDDLHASEDNYYYKITHCDYDWKQSQLSRNEYLVGFDDQRIQDYLNSINYSHLQLALLFLLGKILHYNLKN